MSPGTGPALVCWPCAFQRPAQLPGCSPNLTQGSLGKKQANVEAKLLCFCALRECFRGCCWPLLWAQVSTGTVQDPQGRGEGTVHQMGKPGFHELASL